TTDSRLAGAGGGTRRDHRRDPFRAHVGPPMRILITGALGFAGRHLTERCAAEGAEVVGVGRRRASAAELTAGLSDYSQSDLLDLRQAERAVRSNAPDRVFHLAAEASVARSWEDPAAAVLGNLSGTLNVLEAVRRHAPR